MGDDTLRDPTEEPRVGDIVRSSYDTIGERHVTYANRHEVRYLGVTSNDKPPRQSGCLLRSWTAWCRYNRITVVQRGGEQP